MLLSSEGLKNQSLFWKASLYILLPEAFELLLKTFSCEFICCVIFKTYVHFV